ncbi:HNH endonuclease [Ferruginibacter sp.]
MINCKYLNYNEVISFGTIANEKNNPAKTTLQGIRTRIAGCYTEYLNRFATLVNKTNSEFNVSETDEKAALRLCYSSPTKSFEFIKGKIFAEQPNQLKQLCPYCLINSPKTLDHYIGQAEFPEFAILIRNLIPACFDCNNKKGENWRKNRTRRFIHFHNDNFLNHKFLFARLIYRRGKAIPEICFFLNKPAAMTIDEFRLVKFHFKDFALLAEYNGKANTILSSEISIIQQAKARGNSMLMIKANLLDRGTILARDYGVNYWSAVLYQTLEGNYRFLNSV